MAVAVDVTGTAVYFNTGTTSPLSYTGLTTGTGLTNGAAIFVVCVDQKALTGAAATWGGTSCTLVASGNGTGSFGRVEIWGISPIAHTGAQTFSYSWTGGSTTAEFFVVGISLTGVSQAGGTTSFPNGTSANGTNVSTAYNSSVTVTSATNDMVFAGHINLARGWNNTNQTQIFVDNSGTNINGAANRAAGATTVTMTASAGTGAADSWVATGVDVLAFGAGHNPFILPQDNPIRLRADPVVNLSHIATLLPELVGKDKFFGLAGHPNYDWPNPGHFALRPDPITNKTHIATMLPDLAGKDRFFGLAGHPNYDWPNPIGPPPRQDWVVGTRPPFFPFALPFRWQDWPTAPAYPPRPDWVVGTSPSFQATGAKPFLWNDWPNTPGPPPRQDYIDPAASFPPFLLSGAKPFLWQDWPDTSGPPPRPDWVWPASSPAFLNTGAKPFLWQDWPSAPPPPQRQSWLWSETAYIPVVVTQNPFAQLDWPNPPGLGARADWVWPASNPIFLNTGAKPFLWQDWPSAPAVTYRDVGWIWTETAYIPVAVTPNPFSQHDWPNPVLRIDTRQDFIDFVIGEDLPPINQTDWPNIGYQARAYTDVGWTWNGTVFIPPPAVQAPFAQYDWPNPRALGARSDWIWDASNPAFLNTGAKPFLWQDWPATPSVTYRDVGWIWNETAFIPVTVTVSPFYQTDWPVPSRTPYRDVGAVAGYAPSYLNTGAKPFTQGDWPNPRAALQPLQGMVNAYNTFYVFTPIVTTGVHFNPFLASTGRMKTIS